jgi:hypothetical protein
MPSCHLPPGRQQAILNLLPVIPRPIYERFRTTGQFPAGIQQGLDRTKDCTWAPQMAQFRLRQVVVDDVIITLPVGILGLLPDGWYRRAPAGAPPPVPQDPISVLREYQRINEAQHVSPPLGGAIAQGSPVIVPTIDIAVPISPHPLPNYTYSQELGRYLSMEAGELGIIIWRIPGSFHPMFGTGLGITFRHPDLCTELGRRYIGPQTNDRASWGSHLNCPFGDSMPTGTVIQPYWTTRHFAASHMQVVRLRGIEAYRWRKGGARPAPFVGAEYDRFEIGWRTPSGSVAWGYTDFRIAPFAQDQIHAAPEWPLGPGQFHGPEPGAFLVP